MQAIRKCEALTRPRAGDIIFKRKNALANQKAEEKWNWQGSGSATTATTTVQCKIVLNHQLWCSKSEGAFFHRDKAVRIQRPPQKQPIQPLSPKFEVCTRWILCGPVHNKTLLAISLQERKGWHWAGISATASNWDVGWAATLDLGYRILHEVLLRVRQTCKDNNNNKTRTASYPQYNLNGKYIYIKRVLNSTHI